MNWLLAAVIVFVLMSAREGRRKGFIKKSVGMISWLLSFAVTSVTVPYISSYLQEKTGIYQMLQNAIAGSDAEAIQVLSLLGGAEVFGAHAADLILRMLAFLITLTLVGFLVRSIASVLGIAAKLPLVNGLNRMAGGLVGTVEGILWVWVFFLIVTIGISTQWGLRLLLLIADSEILTWIYRNNLLFVLLKI